MKSMFLRLCVLIACGTGFGTAQADQTPDPWLSTAWTAATQRVGLMNLPDGTGTPLSAAHDLLGGTMDATITVELYDESSEVIVGFPAHQMQIGVLYPNGNFIPCERGSYADGPSDFNGQATFSGPIAAGGWDDSGSVAILINHEFFIEVPLDIVFNSPDLDGDNEVGLFDAQNFTSLYYSGSYHFEIDFDFSGDIGEPDQDLFMAANGASCEMRHPPDGMSSIAWIDSYPNSVSVMNYPDGGGKLLSRAYLGDGGIVDATIHVQLMDATGTPIPDYPAEWLTLDTESGFGNFIQCADRITADGPTDLNGETTFSGTVPAGGNSGGDFIIVRAGGWHVPGSLDLWFNSPDIDGDLDVDLDDEAEFLSDLYGSYNYRSDLVFDTTLGPPDQAAMSIGLYPENVCQGGGTIVVDMTPNLIGATWILSGDGGFYFEGINDRTFIDMPPDHYTLTWNDHSCFFTPDPAVVEQDLIGIETLTFAGTYVPYADIEVDPDPDDPIEFDWELHGSPPFVTLEGKGDLQLCLPPDTYTLIWLDYPGWYHDCLTPDVRTVVSGEAVLFQCDYHEYGTIEVIPDPPGIGATWTVTGPDSYSHAGTGNVPLTDLRPGQYDIVWDSVAGWLMPCDPPNTISLAEGAYETFSCTYIELGTVNVNPEPDVLVAGWHLTGPASFDQTSSGDLALTDMIPGDYELTWFAVDCWTTPAPNPANLTLSEAGIITFTGTYVEAGTITVDGEPAAITPTWHLSGPNSYEYDGMGDKTLTCLDAGIYSLEWMPVAGWILSCPEPQPVELLPGGSLDFTCTYGEAGTIVINAEPEALIPGWHLDGPGDYQVTGSGTTTLDLQPAGDYTLTWDDIPFWVEPLSNPESQLLLAEQTITFTGVYETLPEIQDIVDVDNDQGRRVRITWQRCLYDAPGDPVVTGYGIYRRQDQYKGSLMPEDGIKRDAEGKLLGWDALGMIPARLDDAYQYVAETLCDSTEAGICYSIFMISAVTDNPAIFFDSRPDSGYSVDNLEPSVPEGLLVAYQAGGNALSWNPNPEEDIRYYRVYRASLDEGQTSGCSPLPATPVTDVAGPYWTDTESAWGVCYYITAVDFAGNESDPTDWAHSSVTGIDQDNIPTRFALHTAVPNPFNPNTMLAYDLPKATSVRLTVYDTQGRRIRVLVDEPTQEAGRHEILWRGRDQRGLQVAAGVYFYRLETRDFAATNRMTLLK